MNNHQQRAELGITFHHNKAAAHLSLLIVRKPAKNVQPTIRLPSELGLETLKHYMKTLICVISSTSPSPQTLLHQLMSRQQQ